MLVPSSLPLATYLHPSHLTHPTHRPSASAFPATAVSPSATWRPRRRTSCASPSQAPARPPWAPSRGTTTARKSSSRRVMRSTSCAFHRYGEGGMLWRVVAYFMFITLVYSVSFTKLSGPLFDLFPSLSYPHPTHFSTFPHQPHPSFLQNNISWMGANGACEAVTQALTKHIHDDISTTQSTARAIGSLAFKVHRCTCYLPCLLCPVPLSLLRVYLSGATWLPVSLHESFLPLTSSVHVSCPDVQHLYPPPPSLHRTRATSLACTRQAPARLWCWHYAHTDRCAITGTGTPTHRD